VTNLKFHDLRREFGSRLLEVVGGNSAIVRDWLGHADLTTKRCLATSTVAFNRSGDEVTDVSTKRCTWVSINDPLMLEYHDREWGVPVHEDRKHFEFLVLEAAQAGLSWSIVLKKRDGYRRAFSQFDPEKVARYTENRIQKLTSDPGIIRNRLKIAAAVRNARAFLAIQEEFGSFNDYCWRFVDGRPRLNRWKATRQIPATSPESDAFSKDLKARGFSFVGSTVMYAHMQAVGMVNDHLVDCFRYREIRRLV
jgi:DNA-3-methyladenine glycosylase I